MADSKKQTPKHTLIFLCCLLAMPTAAMLLPGITAESIRESLLAGALLGFAHLLLRPVLRLLSAPIGCLTLGLFGLVIDMALLYGVAYFIEGFTIASWTEALLAVILVNCMCALVGRK